MPFHLLNFPKSNFAQRCCDKAATYPHDSIFERVQRHPNHQSLPIDAFQTTHMLSPTVNCNRLASATACLRQLKIDNTKIATNETGCCIGEFGMSPACGFHSIRSDIEQPIRFAKNRPSPESSRAAMIVGPKATTVPLIRADDGVLLQVATQSVFQRLAIAAML